MSALAMQVLQEAIYSKLTGDSVLMAALAGGVHDEAPDKTIFPYVKFSSGNAKERNSQSNISADISLRLDVYSRKGGRAELLILLALIEPLLDESQLSLSSGLNLLDIQFASSAITQNKDGRSWRAAVEVLALVEG